MAEVTQFTIGTEVTCSDGACGELTRVVVDPVAKAVTHLVVDPKQSLGRLVPLDLVVASTGQIALRCTQAQFDKLEAAEETRFLPGDDGYPGYGEGQVLMWPYYGFGMGGMGMGAGLPQPLVYDTVPAGEVDVRRGERVHATDGEIGRVQGLVVDAHHQVTHVLLQEGHLWGRKEVAIPIGAVTRVDDGIRLKITKDDVQALPSADIERS
jgi:sporulation protein YlmC with PRC-barrel domain